MTADKDTNQMSAPAAPPLQRGADLETEAAGVAGGAVCDCISRINALARKDGWCVGAALTIRGSVFACVVTEKLPGSGRRKRAPVLSASYCPFCGAEYARSKLAQQQKEQG